MEENKDTTQKDQMLKLETVDRLMQIPVVEFGLNYAGHMYGKIKESNNVLNWTFGQAEGSIHFVVSTAMPAINLFNGPITSIDKILYQGLEKVEETIPLITLPPEQIYCKTKEYINDVVLKNAIVADIVQKATTVTNIALESKYTGIAADRLDSALNVAEKYLDQYLPADPNDSDKEVLNCDTAHSPAEKALHTIYHVDKISRKFQRRLTKRTLLEAKALKEHSTEAVQALLHIIDLIATDPKVALQKGQEIWASLSKSEPENQVPPQTIDEVLFMLTREAARRVVHFVNFTTGVVKQLPDQMQLLTSRCIHLVQDIFKNGHLESINKAIYATARNQVHRFATLLHQLNVYATELLEQAARNLKDKDEVNNVTGEPKSSKHSKHSQNSCHKKPPPKSKANGIDN
ncbi:lipid storage droplets surface-binding protein 1-like [Photinus pyralis]|uniref:lipid storage droplets surface-binding protein 1-like n=1 Tax=Photinus pyralis TaxID=7054 RepID=UPI001267531A|nr:lipid storage droplets surface-binding protein 1-like [Photinus pyralis]